MSLWTGTETATFFLWMAILISFQSMCYLTFTLKKPVASLFIPVETEERETTARFIKRLKTEDEEMIVRKKSTRRAGKTINGWIHHPKPPLGWSQATKISENQSLSVLVNPTPFSELWVMLNPPAFPSHTMDDRILNGHCYMNAMWADSLVACLIWKELPTDLWSCWLSAKIFKFKCFILIIPTKFLQKSF